ncbi:hypothetical protein NMY22_g20231 [Coprinellus aureogranulatus]|nr:hypothetical protein NMY22_g20231 [Coprinellus aureogranulatus]
MSTPSVYDQPMSSVPRPNDHLAVLLPKHLWKANQALKTGRIVDNSEATSAEGEKRKKRGTRREDEGWEERDEGCVFRSTTPFYGPTGSLQAGCHRPYSQIDAVSIVLTRSSTSATIPMHYRQTLCNHQFRGYIDEAMESKATIADLLVVLWVHVAASLGDLRVVAFSTSRLRRVLVHD